MPRSRSSLEEFRRSIELINKSTNNFLMNSMQDYKIRLDGQQPKLTKILRERLQQSVAKQRVYGGPKRRLEDTFKAEEPVQRNASPSVSIMDQLQHKVQ